MGFKERLEAEYNDISEKCEKLFNFLNGDCRKVASENQLFMMRKQYYIMCQYNDILLERLSDLEEPSNDVLYSKGEEIVGMHQIDDMILSELKFSISNAIDTIDSVGKDKRLNAIATTDLEKVALISIKSYCK